MIGKRKIVGATAFLLLSMLALNDAESADANKLYSVRGLGVTTCSKYLEDRNAKQSEKFAHWFTGFLTAYNWLKPNTYDIAPQYKSDGLLRYLDQYCEKNPEQRVIEAATSFADMAYDKRQKKSGS
jgi:cell division protein YceG involved in septum cleavage